jgi:hypothetical protein
MARRRKGNHVQINLPNQPPVRDRRVTISLTDEEIDLIAEKAAEKAVAKMTTMVYREVGQTIIQKFFWIVGLSSVGVYVYLQQKGYIK